VWGKVWDIEMAKLTAAAVRSLRTPGKINDGDGLMLDIKSPTRRYWVFRYRRAGRTRWMTFGNADDITLADARRFHTEARGLLLKGLDPLDERDRVKLDLSRSFAEVAEQCIAAKAPGWRNKRGAEQWHNMFRDYANPVLGQMPVAEIGTEQVLKVLRSIWTAKPDVARRLRVRLEAVLDFAIAMHWHQGPNPAVWRGGLKPLLADGSKLHTVTHFAALDWREAPALMAALADDESMAALCLRFVVLTACRSGEARGARWDEIDLPQALWSLPAGRMKARQPHRVPLSDAACELLASLAEVRSGSLVFPGQKHGVPVADMTLITALRRAGYAKAEATVHGMRSCFRDWCADHGQPADLAEQALAHAVGSAVERSYRRSDVIERRRVLMQQWADFLTSKPAQVIPLRAAS
jgi:integrase